MRISPALAVLQSWGVSQTPHSTRGRRRLRVATILASLLACRCALAATPDCEAHALRARESIPAAQLANWEPVNDQMLLVWTLHDSRAHLVELSRPVPGLEDAPTVYMMTRDHDSNVYACGHDEVIVPGGGSARIVSIHYLSEKRTAELDSSGPGASRASITLT